MIKIGIVGATGYTGLELCRLLLNHPQVQLSVLFSKQHAQKPVRHFFPHLTPLRDFVFQEFDLENMPELDLLFLALPHGQSHVFMPALSKKVAKIIDLSADFRLQDVQKFLDYYEFNHQSPTLLDSFSFGIPELFRDDIASKSLCANPGCYPTCSILGLYPLSKEGYIQNTVIIDAKSGVSGAGKGLKEASLFCEANESISAYNTQAHRHIPEIESILNINILFSPHLTPMNRGMLASMYMDCTLTEKELITLYQDYYSREPFIRVCDSPFPNTKYVSGSNQCFISFKACPEQGKIVVFSAIDNLIKGASGQAIQNMNVMFGFEETLGLNSYSPVI